MRAMEAEWLDDFQRDVMHFRRDVLEPRGGGGGVGLMSIHDVEGVLPTDT